jgi:hypothetical protein
MDNLPNLERYSNPKELSQPYNLEAYKYSKRPYN